MRIVVLVKEVPDTYGERTLHPETGLTGRQGENVVDEIDERALEVALRFADEHEGTEVVVLSMAPETAATGIRRCLAMGADEAFQISDARLAGADLRLTAEVLAAALRRIGFDLVIAGDQSTDGAGGVLPVMLSESLGVPALTNLGSVGIAEEEVSGVRAMEDRTVRLAAALPALVSVTEQLPEARFPGFKGIVAAKKKSIEVLPLSDLGIDPEDFSVPQTIMLRVSQSPHRTGGVKIVDDGDGAERLAAFLAENQLL